MAEIDEHIDRISNLPDTLLSLILSFLPTKQAVATIVLSKRWQGIWIEVPALNLDAINLGNESKSTFVDRVLILNVAPSLHRFKLGCCVTKKIKEFDICSWIVNAMRRDIFEMDLSFDIAHSGRGMLLPAVVLVCEKLKVLKLKSWTLPFRPLVHLPNLVTLHFDHISFVDESSLEYLLSRLPCLEELVIKYCTTMPTLRVCSSSLKCLKRLSIIKVVHYPFLQGIKRKIILDTPSLIYLCINDIVSDYEFDSMPSLVEARFEIEPSYNIHDVSVSKVISLLSKISNVKRLNIVASTRMEMYSTSSFNFDFDLPLFFPNLTHLIVSRGFKFTNHSNFWWYLVLWILQHAPNVTSFDYWCRDCIDEENDIHLPVIPTSVSKNDLIPTLKDVTIHLFDGAKSDTLLIEYLLKNATLLQVLRITLRSPVSARATDAIAGLSQVSRASSICKLAYCVKCRQPAFLESQLVTGDCTCQDHY